MLQRILVLILATGVAWTGLLNTASAAVVGTRQALSVDSQQQLINTVSSKLQRSEIRQAMIDLGVDPLQAQQRVASLSGEELTELNGRLDSLPAGGGVLAVVGVVFVVLLILDLTGVINIFSGT